MSAVMTGLALPRAARPMRRAAAKQAAAAPARVVVAHAAKFDAGSLALKAAAPAVALLASAPAYAAQELAQTANEVNILGVLAVGFFILVPVSFLLILYIKSDSEKNEYYDASYKRGDKKAN